MIRKIRSEFFLKNIFDFVPQKIFLKIVQYNKYLQKKLNLSIDSYKKYFNQIEIVVVPIEKIKKKSIFINIVKNKSSYHIYFDGRNKEMKRNFLFKNEKVSKIKIIIDDKVKALTGLFKGCRCLKEIKFIQFNRKDISRMSKMFYKCKSLVNLDIRKI